MSQYIYTKGGRGREKKEGSEKNDKGDEININGVNIRGWVDRDQKAER